MDGLCGAENALARHVRLLRRGLWLGLLALLALPAYALESWHDDQGQTWAVPKTLPTRWIVLGPHLVDMVHELGAAERIVGVQDDHSTPGRHTRSLSGHAVVGQSGSISEERVRALAPDLVVFWPTGLSPVQQRRLRRLGVPLLAIAPETLEALPERLRWLGALAGRGPQANVLADQEAAALVQARQRYAPGPRLRGFYQVWQQPLFSLSKKHLVSQAMSLCGVDSIVPDATIEAPVINVEAVLLARTEIILVSAPEHARATAFWRRFSRLPATQSHAIVAVDDAALTRPGLSLLRAIPAFCQAVMPWRNRPSVPVSP